ncbi:MAG: hypothetical protein FWD72_04295 [Eggerthellaceae bacterium]|nr:hypothetical protein [Eggerthellaceae bacterium]
MSVLLRCPWNVRPKGFFSLKQVFKWWAQESITDEQVQRILEPVFRMIDEGAFDERQAQCHTCMGKAEWVAAEGSIAEEGDRRGNVEWSQSGKADSA